MQVILMELYITRPNRNREFRQPYAVVHREYSTVSGILEMEKDPTKFICYSIQVKNGERHMVLNTGLDFMAADPLTKGLLEDIVPVAQGIAKSKGCELEIKAGAIQREVRTLLRTGPDAVFKIKPNGRPITILPVPKTIALGVSTAQA